MMDVTHLYADGGVIRKNPSPIGGTWAWRQVNQQDTKKHIIGNQTSGLITVADSGMNTVSNNLTEMLAIVHGLFSLPVMWSGVVLSDSELSLNRLFIEETPWRNIPDWLRTKADLARARLDWINCTYILLSGHPTKADLARGYKLGKYPVSIHNVWCDEACGKQAVAYIEAT